MSALDPSCAGAPLTVERIARSVGSSPGSTVIHGPRGQAVSKDLPRAHGPPSTASRAVASLATVYPRTTWCASSTGTSLARDLMTTASSPSKTTSSDHAGIAMGSSGPITEVFALRNRGGRVLSASGTGWSE